MLRKVLVVLAVLFAVAGTARLVLPRPDPREGAVKQLAFLRAAIDDGADHDAQQLFPEGYFFVNVLYGLTWVQVGLDSPARAPEALREANWALQRIQSPDGTAPFDAALTPRYGVFHAGWTNWLRGGILALEPADSRDPTEFTRESEELTKAFDTSETPYLQAYPGQAWPVDSTVAIASLRLHDHLVTPRFQPTVSRWLDGVKTRLDPATGLMPHQVTPVSTGARATSQSMIHRFLVEIDPDFARSQYGIFRERFVTSLGPAVREFPHGVDGAGDVDSGPLVFGVSLSATAVTLGASRVQHDPLADVLAREGDLLGVPLHGLHSKRYALGLVPIGDAFLAWSATARPLVAAEQPEAGVDVGWWWRVPWLFLAWLPALVVWGFVRLTSRRTDGRGAADQ
ncbi:hypothetical protein EV644_106451 [Kribbella orskensis]|uniref:DUF2264 domain-containing protein n=1 Tax=Kribbella orskensis TaxID=2512216 RepID=A0ABY2BL65_9ACTN|nr:MULTISPECIES: hypothetical protein [Kribbella]TCN40522.1 hypothetical protein EV642_105451 [Kribbella sp. VKM Ac-2500]TCO23142.1 hypothetical protein EV644_106451 [Kribbella orskensis]